ncbi:MAG: hypothetical protein JNK00_13075 [Flavipsychrobacter sp.]|nr:hypothetical protein [Flavipsychrobacter sp.]
MHKKRVYPTTFVAWALLPRDKTIVELVKEFGIEAFINKRAAIEKASPCFKVVKVMIVTLSKR